MNKTFKLKINGESPRSLFLAFVLTKLNCNVYLYDFLENSNSKKDYQLSLFSNYTKDLLSKFNLWKEIEDISYGFTSLNIIDNLLSEQLLLSTENFSKKSLRTIGWTANYSDIKSLLLNKLINSDNVHFISKNQLNDESLIFDYEFNFTSYDKVSNLFKFPLSAFKRIDEQILIFNVYLRGQVEKRLYEINTTKGLLVLTPINKNVYQVIWNNASFKIKETSLSSKSFFIDNLSSLLPNQFKIDQIIGEVNFLNVSDIYSNYLIKNKSIYFNENKFKSNTIYEFSFDIIIRNILQVYNYLDNKKLRSIKFLNKFPFHYLLRKYIEIMINFSFSNSLLYLLRVNNIFSLFIRRIIFYLFKKIYILKFLVMKSLNYSKVNLFFK